MKAHSKGRKQIASSFSPTIVLLDFLFIWLFSTLTLASSPSGLHYSLHTEDGLMDGMSIVDTESGSIWVSEENELRDGLPIPEKPDAGIVCKDGTASCFGKNISQKIGTEKMVQLIPPREVITAIQNLYFSACSKGACDGAIHLNTATGEAALCGYDSYWWIVKPEHDVIRSTIGCKPERKKS